MTESITGPAVVLGDDVNTDVLQPSRFFSLDRETRAAGVLGGRNTALLEGAILVAGRNLAVGSSREAVILGIREAGVVAVVAGSISRIFVRNAVNIGLPVMSGLNDNGAIHNGDIVTLDLDRSVLERGSDGAVWPLDPLDPYLRGVLEAGGLIPFLEQA